MNEAEIEKHMKQMFGDEYSKEEDEKRWVIGLKEVKKIRAMLAQKEEKDDH